jgi:peptide/nickel transport system substrate-binding protein
LSGPKRIIAAIKGDPFTLSEAVNGAGSGSVDGIREVEQLVHIGLVTIDGDGRVVPRLVDSVPSLENGSWRLLADGRMETTWRLLPGLTWQDGQPFTADDLVFTATVAQDRAIAMAKGTVFDSVDAVQALDDRTLLVTWKRPFIEADGIFSPTDTSRILPMPRHLLERPYLEDRTEFVQTPYWSTEFVGLGPFKLSEWVLGSHLVLDANERFVGGRPRVDQIELRFVLDSNTTVANVLAGTIDITLGRGLSLEQALQARDQWGKGRVDATLASWTALFPQFINPNPALLANVSFRRALLHALDRQQFTDVLQGGLSPVADSIIIPGSPDYPELERSIVRYAYDPRLASQLLQSLGLTRGSDGFVNDGGNQRISLEVRTTRDDLRERLIHPIGDAWRQIGLGMEPVIIPTQAASDRQYRSTYPAFELTRQPHEVQRYRSTEIPLPENSFRGNNRMRYANTELDALLDRYFTTIPRAERLQALGQIMTHMTDQLVILGIFYTVEPAMISDRLVNVTNRRVESGRHPWNVHEWECSQCSR